MIQDSIDRALEPCRKAIKDADLDVSDINEVILVGGTTRIPAIQESVSFNKNLIKV